MAYPLAQWLAQNTRPLITPQDVMWILPKTVNGYSPAFTEVTIPPITNVKLRGFPKEWRDLYTDISDPKYIEAITHLLKYHEWTLPLPNDCGKRYKAVGNDTKILEPTLTDKGMTYPEYLILGVYPGFTCDGIPSQLGDEPHLKYFGISFNQLFGQALTEWYSQKIITPADTYLGIGKYQGSIVVVFARNPGEHYKVININIAHGSITKTIVYYMRSVDKITWLRRV
jgi:hypothetical protein